MATGPFVYRCRTSGSQPERRGSIPLRATDDVVPLADRQRHWSSKPTRWVRFPQGTLGDGLTGRPAASETVSREGSTPSPRTARWCGVVALHAALSRQKYGFNSRHHRFTSSIAAQSSSSCPPEKQKSSVSRARCKKCISPRPRRKERNKPRRTGDTGLESWTTSCRVGGCRKSRDGQGFRLLPIPSAEQPTEQSSSQFRLFASPARADFALSRMKGVGIRATPPRFAPAASTKTGGAVCCQNCSLVFVLKQIADQSRSVSSTGRLASVCQSAGPVKRKAPGPDPPAPG